jgi:hypothetical protein
MGEVSGWHEVEPIVGQLEALSGSVGSLDGGRLAGLARANLYFAGDRLQF